MCCSDLLEPAEVNLTCFRDAAASTTSALRRLRENEKEHMALTPDGAMLLSTPVPVQPGRHEHNAAKGKAYSLRASRGKSPSPCEQTQKSSMRRIIRAGRCLLLSVLLLHLPEKIPDIGDLAGI